MIRDVKVLVITNINYQDKTNELLEHQFNGTQYIKNNNIFLRYRDNNEQDKENSWTIVKWNEDERPLKVTVIRRGKTSMKNIFQQGYIHISEYRCLNSSFEMEITTKKLDIYKEDNGGKILAEYSLKLNNQAIGDYILEIEFIFDD